MSQAKPAVEVQFRELIERLGSGGGKDTTLKVAKLANDNFSKSPVLFQSLIKEMRESGGQRRKAIFYAIEAIVKEEKERAPHEEYHNLVRQQLRTLLAAALCLDEHTLKLAPAPRNETAAGLAQQMLQAVKRVLGIWLKRQVLDRELYESGVDICAQLEQYIKMINSHKHSAQHQQKAEHFRKQYKQQKFSQKWSSGFEELWASVAGSPSPTPTPSDTPSPLEPYEPSPGVAARGEKLDVRMSECAVAQRSTWRVDAAAYEVLTTIDGEEVLTEESAGNVSGEQQDETGRKDAQGQNPDQAHQQTQRKLDPRECTVVVSGLPPEADDEYLLESFREFGEVRSAEVNAVRRIGKVAFTQPQHAELAAAGRNGWVAGDGVVRCQVESKISPYQKYERLSGEREALYITRIPRTVTREKLFAHFSKYGIIRDCALKSSKEHDTNVAFVTFRRWTNAVDALMNTENYIVKFKRPKAIQGSYPPPRSVHLSHVPQFWSSDRLSMELVDIGHVTASWVASGGREGKVCFETEEEAARALAGPLPKGLVARPLVESEGSRGAVREESQGRTNGDHDGRGHTPPLRGSSGADERRPTSEQVRRPPCPSLISLNVPRTGPPGANLYGRFPIWVSCEQAVQKLWQIGDIVSVRNLTNAQQSKGVTSLIVSYARVEDAHAARREFHRCMMDGFEVTLREKDGRNELRGNHGRQERDTQAGQGRRRELDGSREYERERAYDGKRRDYDDRDRGFDGGREYEREREYERDRGYNDKGRDYDERDRGVGGDRGRGHDGRRRDDIRERERNRYEDGWQDGRGGHDDRKHWRAKELGGARRDGDGRGRDDRHGDGRRPRKRSLSPSREHEHSSKRQRTSDYDEGRDGRRERVAAGGECVCCLWDLDETLIVYSTLNPSCATPYPFVSDAHSQEGARAFKLMDAALFHLLDKYLFFDELDGLNQTSFSDMSLDGYPTVRENVALIPVREGDCVNEEAMAARYAFAASAYSTGQLHKWVVDDGRGIDAYDHIDDITSGWLRKARHTMRALSESGRVKHVVVTSSELLPALCKIELFELAEFFPIDAIYSSATVGKRLVFERVVKSQRQRGATRFVCIGDGEEEMAAAEELNLERVRISSQADFNSVLNAVLG